MECKMFYKEGVEGKNKEAEALLYHLLALLRQSSQASASALRPAGSLTPHK